MSVCLCGDRVRLVKFTSSTKCQWKKNLQIENPSPVPVSGAHNVRYEGEPFASLFCSAETRRCVCSLLCRFFVLL